VFSSYYRAARKASLSINLLSLSALLNILTGLVALLLGYKVIGFAISQLISIASFNVYYGLKGRNVIGVFAKYNGCFDREERKKITSKGIGFLMSPVWQAIYFQGTTFIVRIVLGTESVTIYSTLRTLTRSLNQLFNMVNSTVFPELQFEIGAGHWKRAQTLFRISVVVVVVMAFLGVLTLLLFGLPFYEIWTNNELQVSRVTWSLFVVGILFNALWWNSEMVFAAVNKPKQLAIFGVICSVISVTSSFFLSKTYGLNGIAFGSIIMEVLMAIFILPYGCKIMKIPVSSILNQGFRECKVAIADVSNKLIPKFK
jgi:O-antigen/teichoic acid export membrane protein